MHELALRTGIPLSHRQAFACERDPVKRDFIHKVSPDLATIFSDVTFLGEAQGRNALTDELESIEMTHEWYAGFSCQDVSSRNTAAKDNREIVADCAGKTGSTFDGIVQYLKAHCDSKLDFALTENVSGLAARGKSAISPLEQCIDKMQSVGAVMFAIQLEGMEYGLPARRSRLYMPVVTTRKLKMLDLTPSQFYDSVVGFVTKLSRFHVLPLDSILLPENHALITAKLRHLEAQAHVDDGSYGEACKVVGNTAKLRKRVRMASSQRDHWKDTHLKEFGDVVGFDAEFPKELVIAFPGLNELTQRQRHQLLSCKVVLPESPPRSIDVSQNAGHNEFYTNCLGCVTPKSHHFVTSRCRTIVGLEALNAQGISFGHHQEVLGSIPCKTLVDLAGNAFHAGQCAVMMISVLMTIALADADTRMLAATDDADDLDALWA